MPAWTLLPVRRFSRDQQNKERFACFSVSHFRAKKRRDPLKPTGDRVYVTVFRKETSTELLPLAMLKWRQSIVSSSMTLPTFRGKKRFIWHTRKLKSAWTDLNERLLFQVTTNGRAQQRTLYSNTCNEQSFPIVLIENSFEVQPWTILLLRNFAWCLSVNKLIRPFEEGFLCCFLWVCVLLIVRSTVNNSYFLTRIHFLIHLLLKRSSDNSNHVWTKLMIVT